MHAGDVLPRAKSDAKVGGRQSTRRRESKTLSQLFGADCHAPMLSEKMDDLQVWSLPVFGFLGTIAIPPIRPPRS